MNQERTSGQYKLESVKMYSSIRDDFLEISDLVGELNIYEDMFNNTISGNIIIEDMFNMIGKFPIVGHEDVTILLDTPDSDDEMKLVFQVYKLSDYNRISERVSAYTLNLISKEYILNQGLSVSKSYPSSVISDVVRRIYDELYLHEIYIKPKEIEIENTRSIQDIWIPNWKPFDAINWLASKSVPEGKFGSNFFFYENRDGYHFKSVEELSSVNEPVESYRYAPKNFSHPEKMMQPKKDQHKVVEDYSIESTYDILANLRMGMYSSRVIYHDMINRLYAIKDYDYAEEWDKHNHIGNSMMMSPTEERNKFNTKKLGYQRIVPISNEAQGLSNNVQERLSQLQQLHSFRMNVTMIGDVSRKIGDIIEMEIESPEETEGEYKSDPFYSGRYLVTGIRHIINTRGHTTLMEMVKDSYFDVELLEG